MNIIDVTSKKKEDALCLVYEVCAYIQFGLFMANLSILESFEGDLFLELPGKYMLSI